MANRIWCEAPKLFKGYVAVSGPPSERFLAPETACSPAGVKPYLGIVGAQDDVLQDYGNWEAQTWTINPLLTLGDPAFVDPILIGERYFLPTRVTPRCGETVNAGDADATTDGAVTTWSFCDNSIILMRVEFGRHSLKSLKSASGHSMLELVFDFIR
jgi:polyhydroxybutyrate depolymerase